MNILYEEIIENAIRALLVLPAKKLNIISPKIEELWGYTQEEIDNMDLSLLIHKDYREYVRNKIIKFYNNDQLNSSTLKFKALSKSKETFMLECQIFKFSLKNNTCIFFMAHEFTEISFKDNLSVSELNCVEFIQKLPDIVYIIDNKGKFLFLNKTIKNLGYAPSELLGKHFSEIISPEDVNRVSKDFVLKKYQGKKTGYENSPKLFDERRTGKRKTENLEVKIINKKHQSRYGQIETLAEVNASGLYKNSSITSEERIGTIGVLRDITRRKMLEEQIKIHEKRYKTLADNSLVGISIIDLKKIYYSVIKDLLIWSVIPTLN